MDTHLMLGNEAVARGAWEAGVQVAAAYPGTPSTEIVTNLARYDGVYAEWSTNEKVAYEVAFGAAMGGVRALTAMKSAGGSVAADPLISSVYTGVNGGLVVCLAGDPGMASGMTEQDDRYFGRISSMPMLEPADSQECYEYVKLAFAMSEEFDVPVMVRLSIQTAHQKSIVRFDGEVAAGDGDGPAGLTRPAPKRRPPDRKTEKYCLLPKFSRPLHRSLLERVERLRQFAEASAASGDLAQVLEGAPVPLQDGGAARIGVVSAGAAYLSAREALPGAAFLKLGMVHPLPIDAIRAFAQTVDRLFVVEELEPYLEEQILAAGIACEGKQWFPQWGELTAGRVGRGFSAAGLDLPRWAEEKAAEDASVIPRPPVLCTGCPHRGMATAMKKLDLDVHGDIGCYDLTTLPPVSHMHSAVEMGASIPMEQGFTRAGGSDTGSIAVIGDSTFLHSGLTGLLNAVHQRTNVTVLIQDNSITAMTGGQTNPGNEDAGRRRDQARRHRRHLQGLGGGADRGRRPVRLRGVSHGAQGRACLRWPGGHHHRPPVHAVPEQDRRRGVHGGRGRVQRLPAVHEARLPVALHTEAEHKGRHKVAIDGETCTGCSLCEQLCKPGAISKAKAGVA